MEFFVVFWKYLTTSAPYLLFGFAIAGILKAIIPDDLVKRWLGGKSFLSVVRASIIGIPLPLCSCSVVPTAVSLRKAGANNPATSSFLISTPESGVDSISITYALMDLPMTIMRPIAAFVTAFFAGVLQYFFNHETELPENEPVKSHNCSHCMKQRRFGRKLMDGIHYAFFDLLEDVALWLTIGLIIGGLIEFFVPANIFVGVNGILGKFLILLIGVPLYICASASTPIAASLVMKGLSPGSAIIFLLVGPATNMSNIIVLQKYIGKKGIIINIFSICFVAFIMSMLVDWIYMSFSIPVDFKIASHDHHGGLESWIGIICAVVLIFFLLRGIYYREIKPRLK